MMYHPDERDLALWMTDPEHPGLDPDVRRHLEGDCPTCAASLRRLRGLEAELREALSTLPPAGHRERILALLRDLREDRVLVARLIDDTTLEEVRTSEAGGRILVFEAGEFDLDLRIGNADADETLPVEGVLLGPGDRAPRGKVGILPPPEPRIETDLDSSGGFRFRLPAGRTSFRLRIDLPDLRIVTPEIA